MYYILLSYGDIDGRAEKRADQIGAVGRAVDERHRRAEYQRVGMGVEGYDAVPRLADSYKVWPGWKYLPMGSNFEMIFYRNGKGEVLVKMLRNEEETTIPAISTYKGPYYRWNDLKEYLKSRLPR